MAMKLRLLGIALLIALLAACASAGSMVPARWPALASRWAVSPSPEAPASLRRLLLAVRGGANHDLNVVAVVKGVKHDVAASTVGGVWAAVEEKTGADKERVSVIFKGQKLASGSQELAAAGVQEGDALNIVIARKPSAAAADAEKEAAAAPAPPPPTGDTSDVDVSGGGMAAGSAGRGELDRALEALAPLSASDRAKVDEMIAGVGGEAGVADMLSQLGLDGPMTPEKIKGLLDQLKGMLANPALMEVRQEGKGARARSCACACGEGGQGPCSVWQLEEGMPRHLLFLLLLLLLLLLLPLLLLLFFFSFCSYHI